MAVDDLMKRRMRRLVEVLVLVAVLLPFVYLVSDGTASFRGYKTNLLHSSQYTKEICNGFSLVRASSSEVVICDARGMYCSGNILQIAAQPPLIIGKSEPLNHDHQQRGDQSSYFLYDTSTNEQKGLLSEIEWRSELKRLGWRGDVVLAKPPNGLREIIWSNR